MTAPAVPAGAPGTCRGRPRDERATQAIAAAALRQLEELGYGRMSMESVAAEAGVARATVYRRFQDKADLVTAAIASRGDPEPGPDGPLGRLVSVLEQFDARIADRCLEVIGCLLAAREEPGAMARHRERVLQPRMQHLRSLVEEARLAGQLRVDADVELTVQMLAGAVFARRIAGLPAERGWARRAVDAACRGAATPQGMAELARLEAATVSPRQRGAGARRG